MPHYSALFTLLDCLDLEEVKDLKIEQAAISVIRKLALIGYADAARLSIPAISVLRMHSGICFQGEADSAGWTRLVITTSRHSIEITP